jgi:type I restriction enzyme S subunit
VLYSCVRPYLLNIAVVENEILPPPIASTAFAVLNGFGFVVPRYQWVVLRSPFFVACVEEKMRGQAYPAINDSDFSLLPFPPLAEQHRIVARVDELMALCDRLEAARIERESRRGRLAASSLARLNTPDSDTFKNDARFALDVLPMLTARPDQVKQLRQTILNLAVRGKLVAQDLKDEPASELLKRIAMEIAAYSKSNRIGQTHAESITADELPFNAPTGWQWARLSALFRVITDGDHQPPPRADEGVAFLTIGNITTGQLEFAGCRLVPKVYFQSLAPYRTPAKGDILYTVVGATNGRPAVVETDREFCVQRHIAILKPAAAMNLRFLVWLLASPLVYDQASRSTTGSAQPTIALRPLRNFAVPVPPAAEQHRIVARVDELIALCDQLEASLRIGEERRSGLLTAILGEALRPPEERDEAA